MTPPREIKTRVRLSPPKCLAGYPMSQLTEEMPPKTFNAFINWMRGQTFTVCDGRVYNHAFQSYEDSGCGPHGNVFYTSDVNRFLAGGSVID
jgi:hypothetical protein